jgi:hypothetical protein
MLDQARKHFVVGKSYLMGWKEDSDELVLTWVRPSKKNDPSAVADAGTVYTTRG